MACAASAVNAPGRTRVSLQLQLGLSIGTACTAVNAPRRRDHPNAAGHGRP